MRLRTQGFTLIELSIVLVIIGLIVGGVLTGRDLIEAAQLRKVISDMEQFETASNVFKNKYNCLAGDCLTATNFFPVNVTSCPPPRPNTSTTTTCNGNGDGAVVSYTNAGFGGGVTLEKHLFWQHLALAGLIKGTYTGQGTAAGAGAVGAGVNVPAAPYKNTGYDLSDSNFTGSSVYFARWYDTMFFWGAYNSGDGEMDSPFLTPRQALAFDQKFDDGSPATGKISVWNNAGGSTCATSATMTATYNTSDTGIDCFMIFNLKL